MKEKAGCGNFPQLAESVRLATPLARFGKVGRTASKQGVASSSLAGRAISLESHSIQRSNRDHSSPLSSPRSSASLTDGRGWPDYGVFPLSSVDPIAYVN